MRIFVIAGEPSGDRLGASLMEGFRSLLDYPVEFIGVGGPLMEEKGLNSLFPMSDISIMGLSEIASKYFFLKRRIRETAQAALDCRPDVVITIDIPEFSLRVAKIIKEKSNIRTVHYVAPTVWAWRPKRAAHMAKVIDHVLALFPFEPPYMEKAGMQCDFVGHPVATEAIASASDVAALREKYGLGSHPIALALPGSRMSEINHLLDVFKETFHKIHLARPDLKIILPAAPAIAGELQSRMQRWDFPVTVLDPRDMSLTQFEIEKRAALSAADGAVAASGTVSLELAANATPMVIAYDMGWLSRQIIGRMLITDTVTLVNLVSDTREIPEFIGADCKPDLIADAFLNLLQNPESQLDAMEDTMRMLGQGDVDPGIRAAQAVLSRL
jgi:lipid-A-disaccharide synthase